MSKKLESKDARWQYQKVDHAMHDSCKAGRSSKKSNHNGRFLFLEDVLVEPTKELCLREAEVVSLSGLEEDPACLVNGLQAEQVLLVPFCILHISDIFETTISELTPVLTCIGVHHGVFQSLDHHKRLCLRKVGLKGRVDRVTLIVPLCNL